MSRPSPPEAKVSAFSLSVMTQRVAKHCVPVESHSQIGTARFGSSSRTSSTNVCPSCLRPLNGLDSGCQGHCGYFPLQEPKQLLVKTAAVPKQLLERLIKCMCPRKECCLYGKLQLINPKTNIEQVFSSRFLALTPIDRLLYLYQTAAVSKCRACDTPLRYVRFRSFREIQRINRGGVLMTAEEVARALFEDDDNRMFLESILEIDPEAFFFRFIITPNGLLEQRPVRVETKRTQVGNRQIMRLVPKAYPSKLLGFYETTIKHLMSKTTDFMNSVANDVHRKLFKKKEKFKSVLEQQDSKEGYCQKLLQRITYNTSRNVMGHNPELGIDSFEQSTIGSMKIRYINEEVQHYNIARIQMIMSTGHVHVLTRYSTQVVDGQLQRVKQVFRRDRHDFHPRIHIQSQENIGLSIGDEIVYKGGKTMRIVNEDLMQIAVYELMTDKVHYVRRYCLGGQVTQHCAHLFIQPFVVLPGDVVVRDIYDADIALFIRYPTLGDSSCQARWIFICPFSKYKSIGARTADPPFEPMNGDYDGDEGNGCYPYGVKEQIEAYQCMLASLKILSNRDGSVQISPTDETVAASAELTSPRGYLRFDEFWTFVLFVAFPPRKSIHSTRVDPPIMLIRRAIMLLREDLARAVEHPERIVPELATYTAVNDYSFARPLFSHAAASEWLVDKHIFVLTSGHNIAKTALAQNSERHFVQWCWDHRNDIVVSGCLLFEMILPPTLYTTIGRQDRVEFRRGRFWNVPRAHPGGLVKEHVTKGTCSIWGPLYRNYDHFVCSAAMDRWIRACCLFLYRRPITMSARCILPCDPAGQSLSETLLHSLCVANATFIAAANQDIHNLVNIYTERALSGLRTNNRLVLSDAWMTFHSQLCDPKKKTHTKLEWKVLEAWTRAHRTLYYGPSFLGGVHPSQWCRNPRVIEHNKRLSSGKRGYIQSHFESLFLAEFDSMFSVIKENESLLSNVTFYALNKTLPANTMQELPIDFVELDQIIRSDETLTAFQTMFSAHDLFLDELAKNRFFVSEIAMQNFTQNEEETIRRHCDHVVTNAHEFINQYMLRNDDEYYGGNSFYFVPTVGIKGSLRHLRQCSGAVGVQTSQNSLVKRNLAGSRLSPHCGLVPDLRTFGLIANSFFVGQDSREMISTHQEGRERLSDSSSGKLQDQGYDLKQLLVCLRSVMVAYDQTVRDGTHIIQLLYGGAAFRPRDCLGLLVNTLTPSFEKFQTAFSSLNAPLAHIINMAQTFFSFFARHGGHFSDARVFVPFDLFLFDEMTYTFIDDYKRAPCYIPSHGEPWQVGMEHTLQTIECFLLGASMTPTPNVTETSEEWSLPFEVETAPINRALYYSLWSLLLTAWMRLHHEHVPVTVEFTRRCIEVAYDRITTAFAQPGEMFGMKAAFETLKDMVQQSLNSRHNVGVSRRKDISSADREKILLHCRPAKMCHVYVNINPLYLEQLACERPGLERERLMVLWREEAFRRFNEVTVSDIVENGRVIHMETIHQVVDAYPWLARYMQLPEDVMHSYSPKFICLDVRRAPFFFRHLFDETFALRIEDIASRVFGVAESTKRFRVRVFENFVFQNNEPTFPVLIFAQGGRWTEDGEFQFTDIDEYTLVQQMVNAVNARGLANILKSSMIGEQGIMYFSEEKNDYRMDGSCLLDTRVSFAANLFKLVNCPLFDPKTMIIDDVPTMNAIFGIDMARSTLRKELMRLMAASNVHVHPAHIHLLADFSSVCGVLLPYSRDGLQKANTSFFSKLTFEQSSKILSQGAINNIYEDVYKEKWSAETQFIFGMDVEKYRNISVIGPQ